MPRLSLHCPAIPASRLARWRAAVAGRYSDALAAVGKCMPDGRRRLVVGEDAGQRRAALAEALRTAPPDTLLAAAGIDAPGLYRDAAVVLYDWLSQLRTGLRDPQPLPHAPEDLAATVPGWLARAGAGSGAIIVVDGLDGLQEEGPPAWLPAHLPPRVGVVIGCAPGAMADALAADGWERIDLPATPAADPPGTMPDSARPLLAALWAAADGLDDDVADRLDRDGGERRRLRPILRRSGAGLALAGPRVRADIERHLRDGGFHTSEQLRELADDEPPGSAMAVHLYVAAEAWQDAAARLAEPALLDDWPTNAPLLLAAWRRLPMQELALERLLGKLEMSPARALAAIELLDALGHEDRGSELLEQAAGVVDGRGDTLEAEVLLRRAGAALEQGETAAARSWLERALMLRQGHAPAAAGVRSARHALARALETGGDLDGAEELYRTAVAELMERGFAAHPAMIPALTNLAAVQRAGNRLEPALDNLEAALRIAERRHGADHPVTLSLHDSLGGLRYGGGDLDAAQRHYREAVTRSERAFGPASEATAACWHNLGTLLDARGEYREAEDNFRRALAVRRARRGDFDADTASSLHNLAGVLEVTGRGDEAEGLYREAVAVWERLVGEDHPATATSLNNLADLLRERGATDEAERLYRRNLGIWERLYGGDHPNTLMTRAELGGLYADAGRHAEAEPLLKPAVDALTERLGATAGLTVDAVLRLAGLWRDTGRADAALSLLDRTLEAAAGGVAALSPRLQKVRRHRDALRARLKEGPSHG